MPISDKELLYNSLAQVHWERFARETLALIKRDNKTAPQVFISYAWPKLDIEQDIQAWLLSLYERLTYLGISVLFDIKSMTLGTNIDGFMQRGVAQSDTILIIGTETYCKRSNEPTNVQREVEHIRQKVAAKGTDCVIPILYRGQFGTALPALGTEGNAIQILGTDCHDELLYHNNLPNVIESLFQLQNNGEYQTLKQGYISKLQQIEAHGLSDAAIADFVQQRAQKVRAALAMQQEAVNLMLERNAKGHPDFVVRPVGAESPAIKLLSNLKAKYSQYTHVHALFGEPMALEGQYINVQMLYQVIDEQDLEAGKNSAENSVVTNKEFKDARVTSFESIFSKKEPLEITHLFTPAKTLLSNKQKTNEARPELPPNLVLLQGRAGIGKTTFVNFVTREWAMGRLWQEYNWVFSLRLRDLRSDAFQQASEISKTWRLEDWIYQAHFAAHMDKATFQSLWTWLIEPDFRDKKVLFILDGYDETPTHHPCKQALTDLLASDNPKILTSRPYGFSDLPKDRRELEIVGFVDENVEKYVALYFKNNIAKAQNTITGLKVIPTLWGSAHIPVTLNVICGVLETEQDITATLSKLNTMSGLYETMELSLLERAYRSISGKEIEHKQQLESLDLDRKNKLLKEHYTSLRYYLGKLAFVAFSKQQLILTLKDVSDVLESFDIPITQFGIRIKELLDLGLLKKVVDEATHLDTNYEFLHLSFQEYYAGHHLFWSAEQNSSTMIDDFAKIKLDPRYQMVLWFVAGSIKDKNQFNVFMQVLAAPVGGDMLGNVQLGLMIRCTAENWVLAQQTGWSKAITKILQKRIHGLREYFKRIELNYGYDCYDVPPPVWVHMINLSPQTYQVQSGEQDLFPDALKKANSFFGSKRNISAKFMNWLGIASPAIINSLTKLLPDSKIGARLATARTIDKTGAALVTLEFHVLLVKLMTDISARVREDAANTVGEIGAVIATNDVLAQLVNLVTDSDWHVRRAAVVAIGKLGAAAATPDIIALLTKFLAEKDLYVLDPALEAIGELGAAAATPDIIKLLTHLLGDNNNWTRKGAAKAIRKLCTADAVKDILMLLSEMLSDDNFLYRHLTALDVIGQFGSMAATPEILAILPKALIDRDEKVRKAAVLAIGELGAVAATPDILVLLPKLLVDSNNDVRQTAVLTIGKLGTAAATKGILELLSMQLADGEEDARIAVALAMEQLGAPWNTPEFLTLLAKRLADKESRVRHNTVWAIRNLGLKVATKDILILLFKLLTDYQDIIRLPTVQIIIKFAEVVSTKENLVELIRLFASDQSDVALVLPSIVSTFLHKNATSSLAEIPLFPTLAVALISGAYMYGNTSFNIAYDSAATAYHLRGFADKTPLYISITHAQAQWFIYWTPQIIQSLEEGTLRSKLNEIEKAGLKISSQRSVAWFDQSSSSSSSRSVFARSSYPGFFDLKAYGISHGAVVKQENDNKRDCLLQ